MATAAKGVCDVLVQRPVATHDNVDAAPASSKCPWAIVRIISVLINPQIECRREASEGTQGINTRTSSHSYTIIRLFTGRYWVLYR